MAPDFGGKPFSLAHYLSVRSAVELNNPEAAYFHYEYEPSGEWWDKAKPLLTLNHIKAPRSFKGKTLHHVAHQADVVRLQVLNETGGVYMDLDTISVKPLQELYGCSFAIGQELKPAYVPKNTRQRIKYTIRKNLGLVKQQEEEGLCNAVLLAEKGSSFIRRWMETYESFRSEGRDAYWNEHSVIIPGELAKRFPDEITILGPYAFHFPLYDPSGLRSMFAEVHEFPGAYLHHLWESFSWEQYLSELTPETIIEHDSSYNLLARKYLES